MYNSAAGSAAGGGGGGGGGATDARGGAGTARLEPLALMAAAAGVGVGLDTIDGATGVDACPGSFWATGFGFDTAFGFCNTHYEQTERMTSDIRTYIRTSRT